MDIQNQAPAQQKLELTYKTLSSSTGWYTGLSVKKYLNKNIFSLKKDGFNNPPIVSGRWSAYCHYSAIVAFNNLLDKHEIKKDSKVVVHPLFPAEFVNILQERGAKIFAVDIDKQTLAMDNQKLNQYLEQHNDISLVLFFSFNGIYEPIWQAQESLNKAFVPSLIFVDNPNINNGLLELFNRVNLGSILWDFGKSFVDDVLDEVTNYQLPNRRWFVSWFIENRTKSLLEYHLSESKEVYQIILSAYYYLMQIKHQKNDIKSKLVTWLNNKVNITKNFKNSEEAIQAIDDNFPAILNSAVPDVFFDIHSVEDKTKEELFREEIFAQDNVLKSKAKDYFEYFATQVQIRPQGTIEVIPTNPLKTYFEYFFFSTEQQFWREKLGQKGLWVRSPIKISPLFENKDHLVNANFVGRFLVSIKLVEAIKNGINISDY